MMHKPIQIKNLELSFPHKTCFEAFSCYVAYGERIAIIGRNGSGKSTLLKMILGTFEPSGGTVSIHDSVIGYVPQIIEDCNDLSGGQRFNVALTKAINLNPNVLLLDEPTNHLDLHNRKSLFKYLNSFIGTLIVVSHDTELLRSCVDTLWHVDNEKIHIFSGNYDDYFREIEIRRAAIENDIANLNCKKKEMHDKLMREQTRIAKSKASGEKKVSNRRWLKSVGDLKGMKAEKSQGKKLTAIDVAKNELLKKLAELRLPEIILPKFSIDTNENYNKTIVQITNGTVGYLHDQPLLNNINLSILGHNRIAIIGDNGSGKSTLLKAILGDRAIFKTGNWYGIKQEDIGYLDQHYNNLDPNKTAIETIALVCAWSYMEIRCHLNDFLFRKNEEINTHVSSLSSGEKARLSLAKIAAKPPKLLCLDEITNNLDLETKSHVLQVLRKYTGAMIIISHDTDFLAALEIHETINVQKFV